MARSYWILIPAVCVLLQVGCVAAHRQDGGIGSPATVADAAKVLNLAEIPLPSGAEEPRGRSIANVSYLTSSAVKPAFEAQRKYFLDRGWTEEPNSFVTDESANATLTKAGFVVSLGVIPIKPGETMVTIQQHGNIDLAGLPVPPNSKPLYQGPVSAMFVCNETPAEATETCRKLLIGKGWQPYGAAGDSRFYRQNAVRLTAFIGAAPAQGGKTSISYSAELVSAELPAPLEAEGIVFTDSPATLAFDTAQSLSDFAAGYREALSKHGWKATTENPLRIDERHELIFRNPQMDLLTVKMQPRDEKLGVRVEHQTAAEVAAIEERLRERFKKEKGGEKAEAD